MADYRNHADAEKYERAVSAEFATEPVKDFTADMAGLKAVHQNLFKGVYAWAGKTRAETITINGETVTQDPNLVLTKPGFESGPAGLATHDLPEHLSVIRDAVEEAFDNGDLTRTKWA